MYFMQSYLVSQSYFEDICYPFWDIGKLGGSSRITQIGDDACSVDQTDLLIVNTV